MAVEGRRYKILYLVKIREIESCTTHMGVSGLPPTFDRGMWIGCFEVADEAGVLVSGAPFAYSCYSALFQKSAMR